MYTVKTPGIGFVRRHAERVPRCANLVSRILIRAHGLPDNLNRAALEQLSLKLFGKKLLLPVAAVFAHNSDRLSSAEIARSLGVSPSSVQGPIAVLTELGFIHAIEASPTDRSSWLLKSDSPFWALVTNLVGQTTRSTLF